MSVGDGEVVHRVGGGSAASLCLSPLDRSQSPPGLSVDIGGTPQEAADGMRRAFPNSRKWHSLAGTVGAATVASIRAAGFDVISVPTDRFPNHGRVVHPDGIAGFTDANLTMLAAAFTDTTGH